MGIERIMTKCLRMGCDRRVVRVSASDDGSWPSTEPGHILPLSVKRSWTPAEQAMIRYLNTWVGRLKSPHAANVQPGRSVCLEDRPMLVRAQFGALAGWRPLESFR